MYKIGDIVQIIDTEAGAPLRYNIGVIQDIVSKESPSPYCGRILVANQSGKLSFRIWIWPSKLMPLTYFAINVRNPALSKSFKDMTGIIAFLWGLDQKDWMIAMPGKQAVMCLNPLNDLQELLKEWTR